MKRIAVLGSSGYTGQELLRLLAWHPFAQATLVMNARPGVTPPPKTLPVDATIEALDVDRLSEVDGAFCCTPHGAAAPLVQACVERNTPVVDLSADFRLRNPATYERHYNQPHGAPNLLEESIYGLVEFERAHIAKAKVIANPGCYPTCVLLAILPLLQANLVDDAPIIADCKSGVSGAGKTPKDRTIYGSIAENFCAYGVGTHRHTPEIHQQAGTDRVVFVPHLLPMFRGMLGTIYLTPRNQESVDSFRACLAERYSTEPFVTVFGEGQPELNRVQNSNACHLAVAAAGDQVVITSAIDNLGKGAAGQALQNMNLLLDLPETAGLLP